MARFTHLLSQFAKNKDHERRTRLLDSNRKEVNINANGTSGYTVKEGVNKGQRRRVERWTIKSVYGEDYSRR